MFCIHCGVALASNGKYCPACGKLAATEADPVPQVTTTIRLPKIIPPRPSFSGLRKVNWGLAALLTVGVLLMLLRAPSATGVAIIALVGVVVVTFPVISATALGSEDIFLLGIYIAIDITRRRRLCRVALVFNWIICGFGVAGIVACIATGQIGPMVSMLLYVIVPALNIKALRELARFERDYAGYESVPENA